MHKQVLIDLPVKPWPLTQWFNRYPLALELVYPLEKFSDTLERSFKFELQWTKAALDNQVKWSLIEGPSKNRFAKRSLSAVQHQLRLSVACIPSAVEEERKLLKELAQLNPKQPIIVLREQNKSNTTQALMAFSCDEVMQLIKNQVSADFFAFVEPTQAASQIMISDQHERTLEPLDDTLKLEPSQLITAQWRFEVKAYDRADVEEYLQELGLDLNDCQVTPKSE